jgi:hypothetical protein
MKQKSSKSIFIEDETRFNRLTLDSIKKHDQRCIFEILMSEPENRTVADINTIQKIMINVSIH